MNDYPSIGVPSENQMNVQQIDSKPEEDPIEGLDVDEDSSLGE